MNIINIIRKIQEMFQEELITAFKIDMNLKELIGSNHIENRKMKQAKMRSINMNNDIYQSTNKKKI